MSGFQILFGRNHDTNPYYAIFAVTLFRIGSKNLSYAILAVSSTVPLFAIIYEWLLALFLYMLLDGTR